MDTLDFDSCDIKETVNFSFQSTLGIPISSFIEKLPICSDLCSQEDEKESAKGFLNLYAMRNMGDLYGNYSNDILGMEVWYSENEYLFCLYDFNAGETKYFDITVPCYQSEVLLYFYYWNGTDWTHV